MQEHRAEERDHRILVAIANPATAERLLRLGIALAGPESGELLALFVSLGVAEQESRTLKEITEIVDTMSEHGHNVRLLTYRSTSVARGILDAVREEDIDAILLGINPEAAPNKTLGHIAEQVVSTAQCKVLIYRAGSRQDFGRIVVAIDGSKEGVAGAEAAIALGQGLSLPVEAIHALPSIRPTWEGRFRLEQSLAGIDGHDEVRRRVVTAQNPVTGVLRHVDEKDLLVIGLAEQSRLRSWLVGDFPRHVLSRATNALLLVRRAEQPAGLVAELLKRLDIRMTSVEQDELLWQAREMASPTLDYAVLIVISGVLATLGLLLNNVAVIIGAMLVAPLMQPLIGLASGIIAVRRDLVSRAVVTLIQGVALALIVSIAIGFLVRPHTMTSEILSRTNPSTVDLAVALGSGFVGAYATIRKDIPSALAGVAIAAALMPPLCTTGLMIGEGSPDLALGAASLFGINVAGITVASSMVFAWAGLRPRLHPDDEEDDDKASAG